MAPVVPSSPPLLLTLSHPLPLLSGDNCKITDSIIMGSDYYEEEKDFKRAISPQFPHIGIGSNSIVHKAIIDKNARIGANCQLINKEGIWESYDRVKGGICIR